MTVDCSNRAAGDPIFNCKYFNEANKRLGLLDELKRKIDNRISDPCLSFEQKAKLYVIGLEVEAAKSILKKEIDIRGQLDQNFLNKDDNAARKTLAELKKHRQDTYPNYYPGTAKVGSPCITCIDAEINNVDPRKRGNLTVSVRYEPLDSPVTDADVTIKGAVTKSLKTDASGIVSFTDLPVGNYEITSQYTGKPNKLVESARSKIGSTDWAYAKARSDFPKKTNKCNLFAYEMVTGAGFSVPKKPHEQKVFGYTVNTVWLPPNAGDWANSSSTLIPYSSVSIPEPGDVVAWSHPEWIDATGHVGIVSYPKSSTPTSKQLAAGENASQKIIMRRQTVSAGDTDIVEDDYHFWHYYDEGKKDETAKILFRRIK